MTMNKASISERADQRAAIPFSDPTTPRAQAQGPVMLGKVKHLVRMGASIILLHERSKQPVGNDWSSKPRASQAQLEAQYRDGMNIGVRLGKWSQIDGLYLHVIDVDIRDPKVADQAFKALERLFKGIDVWKLNRVKSGSGGDSRHFYFVTKSPFPSKKLAHSGVKFKDAKGKQHWTWEIELFGTGKQVAIPPSIHPDTGKEYQWIDPVDEIDGFGHISDQIVEGLVNPERDEDAHETGKLNCSYEDVEEALIDLDPDYWCEDREGWVRLGMALHHEFSGAKAAYEVWCDYSRKSEKFDAAIQLQQWKSFDNSKAKPVRMATVFKASHENRRRADVLGAFDEEDELPALTRAEKRQLIEDFEDLEGDRPKKEINPESDRSPLDPDMVILRQVKHEAPPFPINILSDFWRQEVKALATNGAAPIDYAAATLLASAASLIGNSRWGSPLPGWEEPTTLWCQVIGPPSANKSPAMRPYMNILNEIEAAWLPQYQEDKRLWQSTAKQADMLKKQWEQQAAAALEKGRDVGHMPANCIAPPEPARRRAMVGDATLEALVRQMAANPRGFVNYRDEMVGWYANLSRYGGAGATDRPAWLEAYGGGIYTVDRVKDGGEPVNVRKFNVSFLGGIQPEPLLAMASSAEDGLQARFIPFWPEKAKRKIYRGEKIELRAKRPFEALADLRMRKDKTTGLWEPVIVPFSKEASKAFADWEDDRADREEHVPSKLENTFGKARGHVARVALILEMLTWAEDPFDDRITGPEEVSLDSVRKAIEFRENYLKPMQMRVFGHVGASEERRMAKAIAEWITHDMVEEFTLTQVRRDAGIPGISWRTASEQIESALAYLVSLRWIRVDEPNRERQRGRPSRKYIVNERLWSLVNK